MRTTLDTKGYSLVEVLVAVAILLLALVGPMTIAAKSLQSSYYAREQATALFLAQEGIEVVVAIRNDSLISAIKSGNLSQGWQWVNDPDLQSCFNEGCNIAVNGTSVSRPALDQATIESCSNMGNCVLTFDRGLRARYTLGSGDATKYTRVITLQETNDRKGVLITSKVEWDATLFAGSNPPVELTSAVYRIYE
jgi:prepilin-type N-terminal cleavage/methylation domain-containing protein